MRRRRPVIAIASAVVGVGLLAVVAMGVRNAKPGQPPHRPAGTRVENPTSALFSQDETPPYPDSWLSSAAAGHATSAKLGAILPDTADVSAERATAYYVFPGDVAISVTYPLPSPTDAEVRQDYVEVWATSWTRGDPRTVFQDHLEASKIAGASIVEVVGVPAVMVPAHSPSDPAQQNPALLWFVVGDVEYQVSGGDNMDDLILIAEDIVGRATES